MSTAKARLMRRIRRYLSVWKENIGLDNDLGLTDINSDAEEFCRGLLNIVLGAEFANMNLLQMNFPAIDLGDRGRRICVQVTSTAGAEKIVHTLERFFGHGLDRDFDRIIVMILGKKKRYRGELPQKEGFRFDPAQDIWDIPKLLTRIMNLTMPELDRVDAYLREQFGELGDVMPPLDLPVRSALDDDSFFGRDRELDEIARRFEQHEKIVILSGLGGMGKSELAARFAQTRWGNESYFVHFTKNWRQTVLEEIAPRIRGLKRDDADENRIYRDAMAELKNRGPEELLILDNVDQEEASLTQLKRELSELRLRILITTRTEAERAIPVETLQRAELLCFFDLHESVAAPPERTSLIEAVDGHTLTVDLMARALRPGRRAATAEKLLRDLSDTTIRKVDTAYPGAPVQARIIEHLKVVFRVSELDDEARKLLRYATLLPDNGMPEGLFLLPLGDDAEDALDSLIQNGWLHWEDGTLLIHPVIRKVSLEELTPCDDNCGTYLSGLIEGYDEKIFRQDRCRQMAELLDRASRYLEDRKGRWALEAGERWRDIGDYVRAQASSILAMEKMEKNLSPDDPALAQAYNNVGCTCGDLGNHGKALGYHQKALSIRERVLSPDHPDLAMSYGDVGSAYGHLGDHRKALEYKQKAMAILERVLPSDHLDLAFVYNGVGYTYGQLGDHTRALEFLRKALAILEKNLSPDHPNLALSYGNVGSAYGDLGDYRKEFEFKKKALAIWEQVLPRDHPDLAMAYNNMGCTYGNLGNNWKELEFQLKALAIQEKVLPANHPDIALSCSNAALTYHDMGRYQEAARYMRRAADIISRSALPEDHPERLAYPQWADQIEKDARMQRAMMDMMPQTGTLPGE